MLQILSLQVGEEALWKTDMRLAGFSPSRSNKEAIVKLHHVITMWKPENYIMRVELVYG